jgi:hypothetical protein
MTEEIGHFSSANPHKMEQNAQREYSKEGWYILKAIC